jgi:hypothetical protein
MTKHKKLAVTVGSLLAVAILATGMWLVSSPAQVSLAQAPTQTPQADTTMPSNGTWADYRDFFLNALAERLGVTLDKLKEAYTGAFGDTVDKAVQDGKLTEDQATQMKTDAANAASQGVLPGFEGPFGRGGGRHGGGRGGFGPGHEGFELSVIATALNMTEADLHTALEGGQTLADIATEKNVELATIKSAVLDSLKSKLDQAVTDGKMTQAQADQFYSQASTNFDAMASQTWQGRPGPGGPDFDFDGQNPDGQSQDNGQGQSSPSQFWQMNPGWETH